MTLEISTLTNWQKQLAELEVVKKIATKEKADLDAKISMLGKHAVMLDRASVVFKTAASVAQQKVSGTIANIVTSALHIVFGTDYQFKINFVERRNTIEADLMLDKQGHEVDPTGNSGLGVANIIAIALRAAFIMIDGKTSKFMSLDEPTAALMLSKQRLAGEVIQVLCKKLGFQILLTTHSPELGECADRVYFVSMNNKGISKVKLLDDPGDVRKHMEGV